MEVISFHACFRDDACIVIRTVFLSWGGLMNSSLGIIMIGRLFRTVFGVTWLVLLHRWVHMVVVAFEVDWGVDLSGTLVAIFTIAGLGAASAPSLWFLPGGFIFRIVAIILLRPVHHVYIV